MSESTQQFYDDLAANYHLLYEDWRKTVVEEGKLLDGLIQAHLPGPRQSVLDCACGIGTQAIGLALRGYRVHGTDLSPDAVERARKEAASFGVEATFEAADLRTLDEEVEGQYDVAICWANSLPHLLSDEEILASLANIRSRLRPGGLLLISTRDYDQALQEKRQFNSPSVFQDADGRRIVFQLWDWAPDGRRYQVHEFIVREDGDHWNTHHYPADYRALPRADLERLVREAGFVEIEWGKTDASGYPEPVLAAHRSQ